MDIRDMKYIVKIAKFGNMSEAARRLYVPQPTLSLALKRVEEEVKQTLFDRTAIGLEITASGERYVELAQQTIAMADKMQQEMLMMNSSTFMENLRIGVCACWGECLLPLVLPNVRSAFPGITMELVSGPSSLLEEMIGNNEVDVAIMWQPKDISRLKCEVLFEEELLLAISPMNPLGSRHANSIHEGYYDFPTSDLSNQAFILPGKGHAIRERAEAFFRKTNIPFTISYICDNLQTTKMLIARNLGIGFIPERYARITTSLHDPLYFSTSEISQKWPVNIATQKDSTNCVVDFLIKEVKKTIIRQNF